MSENRILNLLNINQKAEIDGLVLILKLEQTITLICVDEDDNFIVNSVGCCKLLFLSLMRWQDKYLLIASAKPIKVTYRPTEKGRIQRGISRS
jgi:hypothetical protein